MTEAETDPIQRVDIVTREDPPVRVRYNWASIANQLRAEPMVWFNVFKDGRVAVSNAVKQGHVADVHPDLGFEVSTTNNKRTSPRTCDMYLRYNPEHQSDLRAVLTASRKKK
jgi:hypothetical protein